ncbi:FIG00989085: hypothetical protein [hydrothermal vent metagenome]|uniref:Glycosyl transferase family 28 C-terminal domain-containing protein n=1 Tax=hydrothermal vent metagenome TaxID=652676 RepID=A0A3B0TPE1_9ZZZZ
MRVLFWVTHLLGVGHFHRAVRMARAMAAEGLDVTVVNGGLPLDNVRLGDFDIVDLPPVRSPDTSYKHLVDGSGQAVTEAYMAARRERLVEIGRDLEPNGILTELFPYGRWKFRSELVGLIEDQRRRPDPPVIVGSIRDIIVPPRREKRLDGIRQLVVEYFDRLLVHGDPDFIKVEETLPLAAEFAGITTYTGYVMPDLVSRGGEGPGKGEVIVSAGGSAFGEHLLATAIKARPMTTLGTRVWRVLVGQRLADASFEKLQALGAAQNGVVVERARADFPEMLSRARLSISQAGYNTTADILNAGVGAVFAPMAEADQTEQLLRVRLLGERGLAVTVMDMPLTASALARGVDAAADIEIDPSRMPAFGGAEKTAHLMAAFVAK